MQLRALPIAVIMALAATAGQAQYVEDSVELGVQPDGIVYNSVSDVVYGTAYQDSAFFAIDCATNQVIARIDSLPHPIVPFYDSIDNEAFMEFMPDSLMVIDGVTHQRRSAMYVPDLYLAHGFWAADDDRLYLSLYEQDSIAVIDCAAESVIERIGVGMEHYIAGVNLSHDKLYVGDYDSATLRIIDRQTNRVTRRLEVGSCYYQSLYSEVHDRFFYNTGHIVVIDGITDSVLGTINMPGSGAPTSMAEIPELGRLLVACGYNGTRVDTVFTVDMYSFEVLARIPVGDSRLLLLRSPTSGLTYVKDRLDSVSVIAQDGLSRVARLGVGDGPIDLVVSCQQKRVYVACGGSWMVYVIRDTLGQPAVGEANSGEASLFLDAQPNPFRLATKLRANDPACTDISVFSQDGRLVRRLLLAPSDGNAVVWDGRDDGGEEAPSGVYSVLTSRGPQDRVSIVKLR